MNIKDYFYTPDGTLIEAFEHVNENILNEIINEIQVDVNHLQYEFEYLKVLEKQFTIEQLTQPIVRSYPKEEQG